MRRTLTCERGVLHRADGSARWAQGGTSVLAAVFGPQSTAQRKEDPEKAIVEVKFTQRANSVGARRPVHHWHACKCFATACPDQGGHGNVVTYPLVEAAVIRGMQGQAR